MLSNTPLHATIFAIPAHLQIFVLYACHCCNTGTKINNSTVNCQMHNKWITLMKLIMALAFVNSNKPNASDARIHFYAFVFVKNIPLMHPAIGQLSSIYL